MVRQAAFKGLRADKPADEVQAETPKMTTKLAQPKTKNTASADKSGAVGRNIPISNPEKALWPDAGDAKPVKKRELGEYYKAIGKGMLPQSKARPASLGA